MKSTIRVKIITMAALIGLSLVVFISSCSKSSSSAPASASKQNESAEGNRFSELVYQQYSRGNQTRAIYSWFKSASEYCHRFSDYYLK